MNEQKVINFPANERKMTFVNEGGEMVLKGAKKAVKITWEVAEMYSNILFGLLEMMIKFGLFVFLLPHIIEFIKGLMTVLGAM